MISSGNIALLLFFKFTNCADKFEGYIIGGGLASIEQFPHSIYLSITCYSHSICGASVLNQNVLLTAAHCLHGCGPGFIIDAYAGHEDLKQVEVIRKVSDIIIHKYYDEATMTSDIGLTVLDKGLPLGEKIKKVIISKSFPRGNLMAAVTGWGLVNDDTQEVSMELKVVRQRLRPVSDCNFMSGEWPPGIMCASSGIPEYRPTAGDSGSALVLLPSSYQQIGLVSFRIEDFPSFIAYTNISYFYSWIRENAKLLYCESNS